jgi:hypothetical protein
MRKTDARAYSSRLSLYRGASSLTVVFFNLFRSANMIRRTTRNLAKLSVVAALIASASYGHAAGGAVTPAFAACSKALIETLEKSEVTPTYKLEAPSRFVSDLIDPNSFTVVAKNAKTKELLAKASCKATPAGEVLSFRTLPIKS